MPTIYAIAHLASHPNFGTSLNSIKTPRINGIRYIIRIAVYPSIPPSGKILLSRTPKPVVTTFKIS